MRRTGRLAEAVTDLDMLAAAGLVSVRRMQEYAAGRPPRQRALVLEACELASEHSRSPQESRLRLVRLLEAGLPPVLVNCPIFDRTGRLLGIADLLDVEAGLVVEYDGADHRDATRQAQDIAKEERLRGVGLEVTRVTGQDLRDVPLVVNRLHAARARASFEAEVDRRWVARPPADVLYSRGV